MATQSSPAANVTAESPPIAGSAEQATAIQQDAQPEEGKQPISSPSVFVNSEPMREDQVQNAVKFLSHPKVRGSPVMYRRSFLEKKGLTKEEIDEAFRLVPDPAPSPQATSANLDMQVKSSPNIQPQAPTQALQTKPSGAAPNVGSSVSTSLTARFRWYHALFAVGLLAASGAGTAVFIKRSLIPRLKSWVRKVVLEEEDNTENKTNTKPSLSEETAAAAKAAAAAASDVAKASQELLNSKNEDRRYFSEFMNLLDVQLQEMKSMSNSIRKLEGKTINSGRTSIVDQEDHRFPVTSMKQPYVNGNTDFDTRSARSSSPPAYGQPSAAPQPKSYLEIMAMAQRGEKPPNIWDINDIPPNPNQQQSNPHLAPKPKPWEVGQAQNASGQVLHSQVSAEGLNYKAQDNGLNHQSGVQKSVKITEVDEDELKAGPYGVRTSEPPPVQRTWVPPQPPPVVMPEAAEAIRRPKPAVPAEQPTDDQSSTHAGEVTDELQRITKISETGGAVEEVKGEGSVQNSSEIQEVQETQS